MALEKRNSQDVTDLETALASLSPRASRVDRDRLLYLAGQASAEGTSFRNFRRRWLWPAATAISVTIASVLGTLLAVRPAVRVVPQIVYLPQPRPTGVKQDTQINREQQMPGKADEDLLPLQDVPAPDTTWAVANGQGANYLRLRQTALAYGVDALPVPTSSGGRLVEPPASYREMTERLLKTDRPGEFAPNASHHNIN